MKKVDDERISFVEGGKSPVIRAEILLKGALYRFYFFWDDHREDVRSLNLTDMDRPRLMEEVKKYLQVGVIGDEVDVTQLINRHGRWISVASGVS